jgi:hypothetical protein
MYVQGVWSQICDVKEFMENNDPRSLTVKPTDPAAMPQN